MLPSAPIPAPRASKATLPVAAPRPSLARHAAVAQALAVVRNTPPPDQAQKQGFVFVPKVGDEAAKQVLFPSAMRILDNKAPHTVIVANGRDLAAFDAALDRARTTITEQRRTEADPVKREGLGALLDAMDRLTVIDQRESGVMRTLEPGRDKLYLMGHGMAGVDGLLYRREQSTLLVPTQAIARQLADAGLDPAFRDIRLFACEGACSSHEGGPSTAERLVVALREAGFENAEVSAYPGKLDASGVAFADGKHHKAVWMDEARVRASSVRQAFSHAHRIEHLSPR